MSAESVGGAVRRVVGRHGPTPDRPAGDEIRSVPAGTGDSRRRIERFIYGLGWQENYVGELDGLFLTLGEGALGRAMMEYLAAEAKGANIRKPASYFMGVARRVARENAERKLLERFPEHERQEIVAEACARVRGLGLAVNSEHVAKQIALIVRARM